MPTLYAGIHLLSHDKPGYVFYSRPRRSTGGVPGACRGYDRRTRTADATQAEMEAMAREMKRRILEINSADPTAVFGLYGTTCAAGSVTTGSWRRGSTRHGSR